MPAIHQSSSESSLEHTNINSIFDDIWLMHNRTWSPTRIEELHWNQRKRGKTTFERNASIDRDHNKRIEGIMCVWFYYIMFVQWFYFSLSCVRVQCRICNAYAQSEGWEWVIHLIIDCVDIIEQIYIYILKIKKDSWNEFFFLWNLNFGHTNANNSLVQRTRRRRKKREREE